MLGVKKFSPKRGGFWYQWDCGVHGVLGCFENGVEGYI
jgi:hypothetical protein